MSVASAEAVTGGSESRHDRIIEIVVDILETDGYDAVQLREVAKRARTSLATIYKRFPTRDALILAALECWMEENRYAALAGLTPDPDESVYAGLMRVFRTIFEPWERHPDMLRAYFRARSAPGGQRLVTRGVDAVIPATAAVLAGADPELVEELPPIVSNLAYGLVARFAAGEIAITEILPTLDRALFRLTANAAKE
ncbi:MULTISPECIES: TetR family transcriptional regulator [Mycobacterium]|uniref:TetR family transcriptional regulator n=1 Tax=Mycobacterium kiyosense TaxID=2871094 RepID=A0A9P3QCN3_9MYCO|nr:MULTISPECIES: TetR family transcriptional regulator [Mycobacterium]BDB41251.1 TetR family transcriptional regulator [Mycobacterium kiyosense]BDE13007.1 TetR family transcriptional regulator [Mycobacterium sp. 20KCMC460]GLB82865.1 TetR family transcriptional regulator [Mycobacterium kiyosense]GLB92132.1 TetR family transcriptional regulator [Mycobacterium kiyosense]GLB98359.1 TetR family transcriptional regulator [Mycobacterium kiyosense]